MRIRTLWVLAAAASLVACNRPEPVEETPAEEPAAAVEPEPVMPEFDAAFIDHMHTHADHMDELMFALSDGDLETAASVAAWLSRHPAEERIPDDWMPYLDAMREAARRVESATDLDAAGTAAEQVSIHCQECHKAAGI